MIYDAGYSPHPNRYSPISVTSLRNGFNSEFMRPSPIRNMNSSPSNAIVAHRQSPSYPSQRLINSRRSPILLVSSFSSMSSIYKKKSSRKTLASLHTQFRIGTASIIELLNLYQTISKACPRMNDDCKIFSAVPF